MAQTNTTSFTSQYLNGSIDRGYGDATIPCRVLEISDFRVKLECPQTIDIPGTFVLLLTKDGHVARKCQLVNRSGSEIEARIIRRILRAAPANDALLID